MVKIHQSYRSNDLVPQIPGSILLAGICGFLSFTKSRDFWRRSNGGGGEILLPRYVIECVSSPWYSHSGTGITLSQSNTRTRTRARCFNVARLWAPSTLSQHPGRASRVLWIWLHYIARALRDLHDDPVALIWLPTHALRTRTRGHACTHIR